MRTGEEIYKELKLESIKNEDFYDALHLNINGAKKFTKILLNDLNKSILD